MKNRFYIIIVLSFWLLFPVSVMAQTHNCFCINSANGCSTGEYSSSENCNTACTSAFGDKLIQAIYMTPDDANYSSAVQTCINSQTSVNGSEEINCFCFNEQTGCSPTKTTDAAACQQSCEMAYGDKAKTIVFGGSDNAAYNQYIQTCQSEIAAVNTAEETPTPIPPLIPELNVEIPNFSFSEILQEGEYLKINLIGEYVNAWYDWLVGAGVIMATVVIMVGGVQYMVGKGSGDVQKAKDRIRNAVVGFVLLLGSYVILNTVSPGLTSFEALSIRNVPFQPTQTVEEFDASYAPGAAKLCTTHEECQEWCDLTDNGTNEDALRTKVPDLKTAGMASPDELVTVEDYPGLDAEGNNYLTADALEKLHRAADIAQEEGVTLYLRNGYSYRSLLRSIKLACDNMSGVPSAVAWPGTSVHGTGQAVDIVYYTDGKPANIAWNVSYKTQTNADPEAVELIADIMYRAGWYRYTKEIWHFQTVPGSCTTQSCYKASYSCGCD